MVGGFSRETTVEAELGAIFITMEAGVIYADTQSKLTVLWAIHLEQVPISITKEPRASSTAEFTCKVSGMSESTYIHWYRAPAGGAPQRLIYLSYSKPDPSWQAGLSSKKLTAHFQDRSICKLLVHKLEKADSGHYYCAAWDYTHILPGKSLLVHQMPAHKERFMLIFFLCFSTDGSSEVRLTQPQLSITREENKTLRIDCHVSLSEDFGKAPIHWYRQRHDAAPERILFISTQSVLDGDLDKGKFNAEKKIGQSTYRCVQIHLRQAQLSITGAKDKTAHIVCEASGIQNFGSAVIHWYRHRPGEAPEQILYISPEKLKFDKNSDENKFNCEKKPDQPISTLTVNEIAPNDGATYYCAYWDCTVLESHR
ncbi:T-cell receptor gamma chain V region PT-gamma-1/2 [Platysternon megacephalum]|nr:T-cell receptor gamma chain V region PT-gamma-1/2 [Platysternon megacephalum]